MKRQAFGLFLGAALVTGAVWGPAAATPANIAAAVADPGRPQADKDRDAARKPAAMLEFARVRPGETVVDFMPGAGYFTRLFSVAVGPKGKVYAFIPTEVAKFSKKPLPANGSAPDPAHPNVTALVAPVMDFSTPRPVDLIWTSQNYHDLHDPFMGPADMAKFDAAVYRALKPGGVFIVLDHSALPGSGTSATNTLHRIDAALVKKEVTAAGFVFVSESNVLRNPADTRTLKVFDPAIRGHTDQFIYKFRKP
ncbi:MAG: class I SAM-dependent methyltransferase [Caulobacteraceae bacterium]